MPGRYAGRMEDFHHLIDGHAVRGPYRDVDDALAQANRTHHGLGGSVWTADVARGEQIAARLESGTAWVNHHMSTGALAPFGGMKWSGIGRENGRWGIEEFCDVQVLSTRFAPDAA